MKQLPVVPGLCLPASMGLHPPISLSLHLYYKTVPQNYPVRGLHFNYETVPAELQLKYRVKWLPPLRLYGTLFPHT